MVYTTMTVAALKLAYKAHEGQLDKSGVPYIFHPFHVAEQMDDEVSTTVALLHDMVEDTSITIEELKHVFPDEVVDAVSVLTRDKSVDYFDYIRGIKKNIIATKVKLADLEHNMNKERLIAAGIDVSETEKLRLGYKQAKEILVE